MSDVLADRIERMERFVKRMNEVERDLTSPYVRPKDAATLILVDRNGRVVKRYAPTDTPEKIAKDLGEVL